MQGDYGLWQCGRPCHQVTYDNEAQVREMLVATGFLIEKEGKYEIDFDNRENWKMVIPSELIPYCHDCDEPMNMNLRCDDTLCRMMDGMQERLDTMNSSKYARTVKFFILNLGKTKYPDLD